LASIAITAKELISNYSNSDYYCAIAAGICGLTIKTTVDGRQCIRYPENTRQDKVQSFITEFYDLTTTYGPRMNIATIVPASLSKYFSIRNPGVPIPQILSDEQSFLLEDIDSLNCVIKSSNINYHITTINLSKKFHSISKKKNRRTNTGSTRRVAKFKDDLLPDGLHFAESIKPDCFGTIIQSAIRDLGQLGQLDPPGPSAALNPANNLSSSQESLSDSDRDFKRKGAH
jgi:hypothetical protein